MRHTFKKDQEVFKNGIPMASFTSQRRSVDLSKHQNFQSVEISIQSRHSAPNNYILRQTEFFDGADYSSEKTEKQNLIS